jgi:hypothetical protein
MVSKPTYDPWKTKLKVEAGKSNPASAQLRLATVSLTIRSKAGHTSISTTPIVARFS